MKYLYPISPGVTVHTVPYGTDLFRAVSLAVNCQATITRSLRDKTSRQPVHEIDSTPNDQIEDEDDDEYEDEKSSLDFPWRPSRPLREAV